MGAVFSVKKYGILESEKREEGRECQLKGF